MDVTCKDCRAEGITTVRPAVRPGPRCITHWRVVVAARREADRAQHRYRTYGLTADQHDAILEAQQGRCAICRRATGRTRALSVDHDHKLEHLGAEAVRGLLCRPCNDLLGHVRDDVTVLLRAVDYLLHPPARPYVKEN